MYTRSCHWCNSSWTVSSLCFRSSVSVFTLVSNWSHLLQASLLGLPNDILNFVLNISLKTFSFTRVLNSDMHFSMYKSYMFFMVRSDERYFCWDYFYENNDLTQLGSFECELAQTEHPLQGFLFLGWYLPLWSVCGHPTLCIFDRAWESLPLDIA